MSTAIHQSVKTIFHVETVGHRSAWARFIAWCEGQEEHRLSWLAAGLAGHGCFVTPLTLLAVMLGGNSMLLWAFAIAAMGASVVVNLAAQPTKVTIPVLFLSLLIDAGIIIASIAGNIVI